MSEVTDREAYTELCKRRTNELLKPGKNIVEYVRKNDGTPRGVMVAYRGEDNKVYMGWSACNTKVDKFNRHIGLNKAITRSVDVESNFSQDWINALPYSLIKKMVVFAQRAERFFK